MTAAATDRRCNPTKTLTADAHPLAREALARFIAAVGAGTEILEAASNAAAQDRLAGNADVSLVILEIALPDAAGTDGLERLLEIRPNVPVLVLPARDDPATARAVPDAGALAFSARSPRPPACAPKRSAWCSSAALTSGRRRCTRSRCPSRTAASRPTGRRSRR